MNIDLLGSVTVSVTGHPRTVRASKVRTMLATLALEPGCAVSRDALTDELWGTRMLGNAGNALQANAARLRKVIVDLDEHAASGSRLRSVSNGYLLDISPRAVDVVHFRELAIRGAGLGGTDPALAVEVLHEALDLWRGPALLDAGEGMRCRSEAARLEERRLAVWEDLNDARITLGDYGCVVAELHQLVARYPLRERFTEQLMLALYRSGRQCDALSLYRCTLARLDEELGLRPGRVMQRMHSAILAQDGGLLAHDAVRYLVAEREGVST